MRCTLLSLLLLAGTAGAFDDVRIGALDTRFNMGNVLVDLGTGPSIGLLSAIARQPGSFVPDRRYWVSGISTLDAANPTAFLGSLQNAEVETIPAGFAIEGVEVLKSSSAAIFGTATDSSGLLVVVGSNDRRAQGGFVPTFGVYDIARQANRTLRLATEYPLKTAGEPSAESTDLQSAGPEAGDPDWDNPTRSNLRLWHTTLSGSGPCYAVEVGQVTMTRADADALPTFKSDGALSLSQASGQCHQRFSRTVRHVDGVSGAESLFVGMRCRETETGPEAACLYKLRPARLGGPLSLDKTWGGGDGQVVLKTANGSDFRYFDHAVDGDGRLIALAGIGSNAAGFQGNLVAVEPLGGALAAIFQGSGVLPIPATGASTNPRRVTSGFGVGYQVTGETYTTTGVRPFSFFHDPRDGSSKYTEYNFPGRQNSAFYAHVREPNGAITAVGTWFPSYPSMTGQQPLIARIVGPTVATEAFRYYHREFEHNFVTSLPDEIAKLNAGMFTGWEPTGESFYFYRTGTPDTWDLHRFFSTSFGDKSSHVFTANSAEKVIIDGNRDWSYEGVVGAVRGLAANGECPADSSPVHRAYNNGAGGAPNHLFTMSQKTLSLSLSIGYSAEGYAPRGRIFCAER